MVRVKGGAKMAKRLTPGQVWALKGWSVKTDKRGFYIRPTNSLDYEKWRGPYLTLQRACIAIARKMQAEVVKRAAP
jgi:hypothetical protein